MITQIELFAGIGGFGLAAEQLGVTTIAQVEINKFCQTINQKNYPHAQKIKDITTWNASEYRGQVDIVCGGFPCQPFSHAGKRGGSADHRYLWDEMLRVIREIQPPIVFAENVAGLLSMGHQQTFEQAIQSGVESKTDIFEENSTVFYTKEERGILHGILTDLEQEGYQVITFSVPASAIGAVHQRQRILIIAQNNEFRTENVTNNNSKCVERSKRVEQSTREQEQNRRAIWSTNRTDYKIIEQGRTPNTTTQNPNHTRTRASKHATQQARTTSNEQCQEQSQYKFSRSDQFIEQGSTQNATNISSIGSPKQGRFRGQMYSESDSKRQDHRTIHAAQQQATWLEVAAEFCRVDDGLPDWVDSSTRKTIYRLVKKYGRANLEREIGLDLSKVDPWRKERLQSLGNAVVPEWALAFYKPVIEAYLTN